ncbi:hypothetical protein GCM10029964_033090 [Kibdelosporangium lantanae]
MSSNRRARRRTLSARLIAGQLALLTLVCLVIGGVTLVLVQALLVDQLDGQLTGAGHRATNARPDGPPPNDPDGRYRPGPFVQGCRAGGELPGPLNTPGLPPGTVIELFCQDGSVLGGRLRPNTATQENVPDSVRTALRTTPVDGHGHTVDLGPGLGAYRVMAVVTDRGDTLVTGLQLAEVTGTLATIAWILGGVSLVGLVIAGLAGVVLVRRTLRPLNRVAATASRVAELPLDKGEIALSVRVPEQDTDPHTEVGKVGAALNRMLGHIGNALTARHASEMRVRQFVADASHELRTPLAAIRGYAELAERHRDDVPPEVAHAVGRVESEAVRMTSLVEDLLLLARLDAGRPVEREPVEISQLVVDAVSDARAAGPDHVWKLDLPAEPLTARGDRLRLHQVLANLLGNARTHTPPGTTVVTSLSIEDDLVVLAVTDNGPGIPETLQPEVFERFARADTSRSRAAGSTGLGLAIVAAVVHAHNGTVALTSRPGRPGSRSPCPAHSPRTGTAHQPPSSTADRGPMTATVLTRPAPVHQAPKQQARWTRPAFWLLLAGTAVLYLWDLGASGYGNDFYAAAVQAGTQSWKAWFFGSLDAGNAITVDKPPAALWVMGLSGRIFGFSSWSMLAPQALEGVASVALLYAAVKRWSGPVAGLLTGGALALTPVAALMFRFNNPDALLVLLLVVGAYCVVRATETASGGWLALAGVAIGFGFLTKMLQAFLVLPAFGLVYLVAAPTGLRRRLVHLAGAVVAVVVSAGWYVAAVDLTTNRPYIGGSGDNTELGLALGYNGLSRIFGGQGNGGGPGGGGPGGGGNVMFGGSSGLTRMFGASFGTEVSWLLPAALVGLVAGLWFTRRAPRTNRTRAALLLWGGWLVVTGLVFSYMQGTVHPYYSVALAPAIAALVAIAGRELWRGRANLGARLSLAAMVAVTAMWSYVLLSRTPDWLPALRWVVLVGGLLVAAAIVWGRVVAIVVVAALIAASGPYAVATAAQPHTGSIPISGPTASGGFGGGGFEQTSTALVQALQATTEKWAAASMGSQGASGLQLASGKAVMAIGGFTGSDPAPTLDEFKRYVADHQIHYFVAGGRGGFGGFGGGSDITSWVQANFTATTIGGQTVYDLTR